MRNVAKVVEPPRMTRVVMRTLTHEDVSVFLDAARDSDHYVYFATLLYTGLRRGELLALRQALQKGSDPGESLRW